MDFRRFLRGPAFFVVVGLLLLLLATQIFSSGGFQRIDTADGLQLLADGEVEQAST
jgi:cell division protease FtsH